MLISDDRHIIITFNKHAVGDFMVNLYKTGEYH